MLHQRSRLCRYHRPKVDMIGWLNYSEDSRLVTLRCLQHPSTRGGRYMPACPGCGAENETGYRFCMACGQPLLSVAEQPQAPEPALSASDLLEAGIVCPACDTYNEPTQRKCINCGKEFSGVTGLFRSIDAAQPPPRRTSPTTAARASRTATTDTRAAARAAS